MAGRLGGYFFFLFVLLHMLVERFGRGGKRKKGREGKGRFNWGAAQRSEAVLCDGDLITTISRVGMRRSEDDGCCPADEEGEGEGDLKIGVG